MKSAFHVRHLYNAVAERVPKLQEVSLSEDECELYKRICDFLKLLLVR